jgi:hypothetical protein
MKTSTEDFAQDAFARVVGEGLRQRAAEELLDSSPGTRVQERVAQLRRRRQAAFASLAVVALLGTGAVAHDPALPGKVAKETAAGFGLRFDEPHSDHSAGKVGSDPEWSREVAAGIQRQGVEFIGHLEHSDEEMVKDAEDASYRVLWADDLAGVRSPASGEDEPHFTGARVAVLANTTTGAFALAQGVLGASPAQMSSSGDLQGSTFPASWALHREGSAMLLVVAPGVDEVSYSPVELGRDGRLAPRWSALTKLGNGVWIAERVAQRTLRVRVGADGRWVEALNEDLSPFAGAALYGGSEELLARQPPGAEAARAQSERAKDLFGSDWSDLDLTKYRRIGDGHLVVHADRGRDSGAWALTAQLYVPSSDPLACCNEEGDPVWQYGVSSPVVAAPGMEPASLMAALQFPDQPGQPFTGAVVVLTPEGASRVRVGTETYPVHDRLAVVEEGFKVGADDVVVAVDSHGAELGRTRLGVPSDVDSLVVQVPD